MTDKDSVGETDYATFRGMLAEGFHTAFRKASDSDEAWRIWKLIREMPPAEWSKIISFVADPTWDMLQSGLEKATEE